MTLLLIEKFFFLSLLLLLLPHQSIGGCETRSVAVAPLYRTGNSADNFLSVSQSEMVTNAIAGQHMVYMGVVGYVYSSMPAANGMAIYRYVTNNIGHFFTTNSTVVFSVHCFSFELLTLRQINEIQLALNYLKPHTILRVLSRDPCTISRNERLLKSKLFSCNLETAVTKFRMQKFLMYSYALKYSYLIYLNRAPLSTTNQT